MKKCDGCHKRKKGLRKGDQGYEYCLECLEKQEEEMMDYERTERLIRDAEGERQKRLVRDLNTP